MSNAVNQKIVVVGSTNADLTAQVERHPLPGETLLGTGATYSPGGKGANQAVAAGLLGARVAFVGAVGDDDRAATALKYFERAGVDRSGVAKVEAATGTAIIVVAADGENTIVVVSGANRAVTDAYVEQHARQVADADIVVLQGEIPRSGFDRAAQLATGRLVVNLAPVIEVGHEELLRADPLVVNEHEAGLVLEQLGQPAGAAIPRDLVRALRDQGFASVVLTLGAAGAVVADADGVAEIPTPRVRPVDTTGAGDAFVGALVSRLAAGKDLRAAAAFAARVGAQATLSPGTQDSYPAAGDPLPEV